MNIPEIAIKKDEWEAFIQGLPSDPLFASYLDRCRWYKGKARKRKGIEVRALIPVREEDSVIYIYLLLVEYEDSESEYYLLPLTLSPYRRAEDFGVMAWEKEGGALIDASVEKQFPRALFRLMAGGAPVICPAGTLTGEGSLPPDENPEPELLPLDQSNSAISFGGRYFFKLYRSPFPGIHPEPEMLAYLSGRNFPCVPHYEGRVLFWGREGEFCLGALFRLIPNQGNGWAYAASVLDEYLEKKITGQPVGVHEVEFRDWVSLLGLRTGEMHRALSEGSEPAFKGEPFTAEYGEKLYRSVEALQNDVWGLLEKSLPLLSPELKERAAWLLATEAQLMEFLEKSFRRSYRFPLIRIHGDYHLGQVLKSGGDVVVIDFEGEPGRSYGERREKFSPLKDVAGMLRSFHYAVYSALFRRKEAAAFTTGELLYSELAELYLDAYFRAASSLYPGPGAQREELLKALLIEKGIYEIGYELNNRPQWAGIPVTGLATLLSGLII